MDEQLSFTLPTFSGPLDLLLHLIEKNKVSIYDIPIAEITDQYMAYLDEMKRRDLDIMSGFLVMAATLLSIKAAMLLPREETEEGEEIDPRDELVEQLLEYKMVKTMAGELRAMSENAGAVCYKQPTIPKEVLSYEEPLDLDELTKDLTLKKLNEIFEEVLKRANGRVDPVRSGFGQIKKEEVSVDEKIEFVSRYVSEHRRFSFRELLETAPTKTEVIVTFLAILELMKAGEIATEQDANFGEIVIESRLAA